MEVWVKGLIRFSLLLLLSISISGCSRDAIVVDGEGIPKSLFDLALKERLDSHKSMNIKVNEAAIKKSVAEELIGEALLVKEAKARKITVSETELKEAIALQRGNKTEKEFKEKLKKSGVPYDIFQKRIKDRIMITKLLNGLVKGDSITEEEMRSFYKGSPVPFLRPERDLVKVLQLNSEEEAKRVMKDIREGADFDILCGRLVKEQKASATDYGWIEPDVFSKEIAEAMKSARLNQVYGPFKGRDNSYYIFKIKERQPSRVLSYDEARDRIRDMIIMQKRNEAAANIIMKNRERVKIKFNIKV